MSNIVVVDKDQIVAPDPLMEAAQEEIDAITAEVEAAKAAYDPSSPWGGSGIVDYYQEQMLDCDQMEALKVTVLKGQIEAVKRHYKGQRAALDWVCREDVEREVAAAVRAQPGKKKSVAFKYGTAGFRKVGGRDTVVIDDEAQAIKAAKAAKLAGVVTTVEKLNRTALLKHMKQGTAVAGAHRETTPTAEKCFVGKTVLGKDELPAPPPQPQLPAKPADDFFDNVNDAGL